MPPITRRELAGAAASLSLAPSGALSSAPAAGKRPENLLSAGWTLEKLVRVLIPREIWKPFPTVGDRRAWEAIAPDARTALVESGVRQLDGEWTVLPATLFLDFAREGNRKRYERARRVRRDRLCELVLAECAEDKGRFLDEIANGIWLTCEETWWGVPAHLHLQREAYGLPDATEPVVDLFAAETGSLLAWADYLLGARLDKVSATVRRRIHYEIGRRILTPNFERVDFWWMGLDPKGRKVNNWNPWINSNWLTCVLLEESDPRRRVAAVHKIMRSLDRFLAVYHDDGGCDEGPSYWFRAGGSLFDCLELLHSATRGAVDVYGVPLVREIGRYVYRAHIAGEYVVNFADAPAKLRMRGDLVFRYGRRIEDPKMQAFGAWAEGALGSAATSTDSIGRQLPALFDLAAIRAADAAAPMVRDVWLPGIQVMAARMKEGAAAGLYVAAKGGHNAESHNHNDVGNFILYAGGKPAIIDVGVETYSAKTFSSRRYEIWTMQSGYHNVPTVGGVMQSPGRQFAAGEASYQADDRQAEFGVDIAKAYPPEAGIASWRRTVLLDRGAGEVRITDRYRLAKPVPDITLTLMTPYEPRQGAPGKLALGPVEAQYDGGALSPVVEEIRIEDPNLKTAWGERLWRVLLKAEKPPVEGTCTIKVVQTATF